MCDIAISAALEFGYPFDLMLSIVKAAAEVTELISHALDCTSSWITSGGPPQ